MATSLFHSTIQVSGADAAKFLQGQLTCDVNKIGETLVLGAHCNPKGRVISLFWLAQKNKEFTLRLPTNLLGIALANLQKYGRLFKGCKINVITTHEQPDPQQWRLENIRRGIPIIYAATSGLFLPHDLNLPQLDGVSFTKGCYTGQEIIARMQHLGKPKRHLYHITFATSNLPVPGEKLCLASQAEHEIGYIVDAVVNGDYIEASAVLIDSAINNINLPIIIGHTVTLLQIKVIL